MNDFRKHTKQRMLAEDIVVEDVSKEEAVEHNAANAQEILDAGVGPSYTKFVGDKHLVAVFDAKLTVRVMVLSHEDLEDYDSLVDMLHNDPRSAKQLLGIGLSKVLVNGFIHANQTEEGEPASHLVMLPDVTRPLEADINAPAMFVLPKQVDDGDAKSE